MTVRYKKEQLRSPDFTLPPLDDSPDIIKYGFYKWELMPYVENEERLLQVSCSECPKTYRLKWPLNTTTLKNHSHSRHADTIARLEKEAQDSGLPRDREFLSSKILKFDGRKRLGPNGHENFGDSPSAARANAKRASPFDLEHFKMLTFLCANAHNRPMHCVENQQLRSLIDCILPDIDTDMSASDMQTRLNEAYATEFRSSKTKFATVEGPFALTIDSWKSKNEFKVLPITLHYLNSQFEPERYAIGFEIFKESGIYWGKDLNKVLVKVLDDYNIRDRVTSITRESTERNDLILEEFTKEYNEKHHHHHQRKFEGDIRCVAHALKVAMECFFHYTFFEDDPWKYHPVPMEDIDKKFPKFKKSIKFVPHTMRAIAQGTLRDDFMVEAFDALIDKKYAGENAENKPRSLVKDSRGSWRSTLAMIDRFIFFRKEVTELLRQVRNLPQAKKDEYLEWLEWDTYEIADVAWDFLGSVRDILRVFSDIKQKIEKSSEQPIIIAIPTICDALKQIDNFISLGCENTNPYIDFGLRKAKSVLLEYYPIHSEDITALETPYLATVLDPRFKLAMFQDLGFTESVVKQIEKHFYDVYRRYQVEYEEGKKSSQTTNSEGNTSEVITLDSDDENMEPVDIDYTEVKNYLSSRREPAATNIFDFYKSQKEISPILYGMAKNILAIPATTVLEDELATRVDDIMRNNKKSPRDNIKKLAILNLRKVFERENMNSDEEDKSSMSSWDEEEEFTSTEEEEEDEDMDSGDEKEDDGCVIM